MNIYISSAAVRVELLADMRAHKPPEARAEPLTDRCIHIDVSFRLLPHLCSAIKEAISGSPDKQVPIYSLSLSLSLTHTHTHTIHIYTYIYIYILCT
jgi:hypothetical protein